MKLSLIMHIFDYKKDNKIKISDPKGDNLRANYISAIFFFFISKSLVLRNTVIRVLTNKWIKRKRKWVIDLIFVFRLGRQQLVSWRDPPFVTQRALQSLWCVNHHVYYFSKTQKEKFLRRLMLHRGTKIISIPMVSIYAVLNLRLKFVLFSFLLTLVHKTSTV